MSCVMCESDAVQLRPAVGKSLSVLNCKFNKKKSMLPEDDHMIEICRSILSILMEILAY